MASLWNRLSGRLNAIDTWTADAYNRHAISSYEELVEDLDGTRYLIRAKWKADSRMGLLVGPLIWLLRRFIHLVRYPGQWVIDVEWIKGYPPDESLAALWASKSFQGRPEALAAIAQLREDIRRHSVVTAGHG